MTVLTASTSFTIQAAEGYDEEALDLTILPKTNGVDALRELHYPGNIFPPIIYPDLPDKWENFDTIPLTGRPLTPVEQTLAGNQALKWPGYWADRPVKEYWSGDNSTRSRLFLDFLRRLVEFYFNPPADDFITWWPRDRTLVGYKILIESVALGGQDLITLHYLAARQNCALEELVFTFRIMGIAA
ncbi:MAG: hypothetical protein M1438_20315 [Deltaproteobacteria bacterium]|nr:hypothetical protein [Deltaproteobacteria bacterium]